jgi:L,D-peptidoglycan transpeptidase YkuD (ErfK/YbiS/YcfS/YnhG family)
MKQLKTITSILIVSAFATLFAACGHSIGSSSAFHEAQRLFNDGNYADSLRKYQEIVEGDPPSADRALFEMGMIYANPQNEQRDYHEASSQFQKIVSGYTGSGYRQNSEMMLFYLNNIAAKDDIIGAQQARMDALQKEVKAKESDVASLEKKIEALQQQVLGLVIQTGSADRILVYKKDRRMMLLSKGDVIKTYRIALGGNPVGPKEREGDKKTPEGTYVIDSKNRDSQYHLSLHISYPNEQDRKRAKDLGVSPGGDITIHGIKSGYSWVGASHAGADWTRGCIAVTDEEIEEIDKMVQNGTVVEILP